MVEEVKERDILSQVRLMYVGDDTGLLKKVKLTAKRQEKVYTMVYGGPRTIVKRRKLADGDEDKVVITRPGGVLKPEDN